MQTICEAKSVDSCQYLPNSIRTLYTSFMKQVDYRVVHQYQKSPTSCSQTALSILLSHYGIQKSQDEILQSVPQVKDENGKDSGSINQQLAGWCISLGFEVKFYTFDCQVIDQSWTGLAKQDTIARLQAGMGGYEIPSLGQLWSNAYRQAYVDYLKAGGELYIQPAVTSGLLYELLEHGPILPCVSFSTLYGTGRTNEQSEPDDVTGKAWNHSIVVHGVDEAGSFRISDPLRKPGSHIVEPERMIAAISTAQLECDNLLFQIQK